VGTLVALLWYFRREWIDLAYGGWLLVRDRSIGDVRSKRALLIVVATIPAGIAGLLLEEYAETVFRAPLVTAIALIVMGALLWGVDAVARRDRARGAMTWKDAVLIGFAQCLALVPGVSRSGSTITAGRALGLERADAAVFSFLMSMPIILAAAVFKVPDAIRESGLSLPLLVGVASAALSSWLAIAVLLRYVARRSFAVFAIYRFALGALILGLIATRGGW
jgi:undecaprenyl-diphosphatase